MSSVRERQEFSGPPNERHCSGPGRRARLELTNARARGRVVEHAIPVPS